MPTLSEKFLEWDVKYVIFDSPSKARVYYKDGTSILLVWDESEQEWVNAINKIGVVSLSIT